MSEDYFLAENNNRIASSSVEDAQKYRLPIAKYMLVLPFTPNRQQNSQPIDGTYQHPPIGVPLLLDSRKQKL